MSVKVTVLGCGGATGTPSVEWGWGRCDPGNPRNRRLRPSILVESGATRILVDTTPDLRQQLLASGVRELDAIVYTHAHADHLHGIDDVRSVNRVMNRALPAYATEETIGAIRDRFAYVLEPLAEGADGYYKPTLVPHLVRPGDTIEVGGTLVQTFVQDHGWMSTLGLRFGPVAYSTDVVTMPEEAFAVLAGVDTWILDVFTDAPSHPTHADLAKALSWIARVRPRRAVLTHMSARLDYDALRARLPAGVEPAYDGMMIEPPGEAG
jgi:phosphoribosyl 1,2-cyclic phosphate phosphodiesterase